MPIPREATAVPVVRKPEAFFPNVFVTETGHLTVDQEPIRVPKSAVGRDGRVTLSWSLAASSPETFPANGVVIDAGPRSQVKFDCGVKGSAAKVYQCSFVPPAEKYRFKYTVYVRRGDKTLEALDPFVEGGY